MSPFFLLSIFFFYFFNYRDRPANLITVPRDTAQDALHSTPQCKTCGRLGHRRITHADCLMNPKYLFMAESAALAVPAAPTAPAAPIAPIAPAAPAASPAPAAPPAPGEPRVFGNGKAAIKEEQDDTEYKTLGRMNVACSHCTALHWIEVLI